MNQQSLSLDLPSQIISPAQFKCFPSTRYQGSKRKILPFLYKCFDPLNRSTILDLYSGTASVSLLLRQMGFTVYANDYMKYNYTTARLLLGLSDNLPSYDDFEVQLHFLFSNETDKTPIVANEYEGIYFTDSENLMIDRFCHNLPHIDAENRDLMIYLMGQAMLMKRPYNLFHRANLDMRTRSVSRSFGNAKTWSTSFQEHMKKLFFSLKKCRFSGPEGHALNNNTSCLDIFKLKPDIIYMDPPYVNKVGSVIDYANFYHFLEGLVDYDCFKNGNQKFAHKPIASYDTAWKTAQGGLVEIENILDKWPKATIVISYRGDGKPSMQEIIGLLKSKDYDFYEKFAVEYKYALSKVENSTEEVLIARRNKLTDKV